MAKSAPDIAALSSQAARLRGKVVEMSAKAQAAHLASALSCCDILSAAYWHALNVDPKAPWNEERDRFILSKGHAAMALFATLAFKGFIPVAQLDTFCENGGQLAEQGVERGAATARLHNPAARGCAAHAAAAAASAAAARGVGGTGLRASAPWREGVRAGRGAHQRSGNEARVEGGATQVHGERGGGGGGGGTEVSEEGGKSRAGGGADAGREEDSKTKGAGE